MAILQYLEDTRPEPTLVPSTPLLRARMREICETIVSGIQPLQNVGLRKNLSSDEQYVKFTRDQTERGLQTLEVLLEKTSGQYCIEDQLTMADLCLLPQLYNAVTRHKLDLGKYKTVSKLYKNLLEVDLFKQTHPDVVHSKI